jgi:hypothetical protein
LFHAAPNCKQKDFKNMLVDTLLPELEDLQSFNQSEHIIGHGDFRSAPK